MAASVRLPHKPYMLLRFVIGLGFTIALLVVGGLLLGGVFMGRSIPKTEGQASVAGLSSTVTIDRDEYGIPHIRANTDEDAYRALGYVHAQDRLFQMEMIRRIGEGRLSEISGEKTLLIDAWSRMIGFRRIATEMWKKAEPATKRLLTAYTEGINSYIRNADGNWGFEYDAINVQPQPWRPEESLMIGRLMAWEMNFSYWTDAAFGDIALGIDSARLNALFPNYPADGATVVEGASPMAIQTTWKSLYKPLKPAPDTAKKVKPAPKPVDSVRTPVLPEADPRAVTPPPLITPTRAKPKPSSSQEREFFALLREINQTFDEVLGPKGIGGGSNAIAIAPRRSASGGALLENDMHLQLSTPSRWHLAHISSAEGMNVAGFCVPGLPAFIAGRNEDLSWGVTNTMADESDFFIETLDSTGKRYMTPRGPQAFVEIYDTIIVKDSLKTNDAVRVPIVVRQSIHGPVVSDIHPFRISQKLFNDPKAGAIPKDTTFLGLRKKPVSLMWNGLYAMTDEIGSVFRLQRAKNVQEARAALRGFATPCLNMCFADRQGNIAYQYIGRMPRRSGSEERILLPRDGNNAAHAWSGFVTLADLPSLVNPPRGYIVSANNPATSNRPFPYSNQWEPAARAERIAQMIEQSPRHDSATVKQISLDITSPYDWRVVLPRLLALYPDPQPVRIEADSSFLWSLDSMKLAWRRDSIMKRAQQGRDSIHANLIRQDSIALARPWRARPVIIKQLPQVEKALEYLRNWNGAMHKDETAPAIYSVFLQRLIENTFRDELGEERYRSFMYVNNVPLRSIARVLEDNNNIWWDKVNTRGAIPETRDSIIKYSFIEALKILRNSLGADLKGWQWGRLHKLTYKHLFAEADKRVAQLVNIESGPMSGSPTTVFQATYHMWRPYEMKVGPSMRMIADMKTNSLYAALPTGNSEAVFGDHNRNMVDMFKRGDFIDVPLGESKPEWKRFELVPGE